MSVEIVGNKGVDSSDYRLSKDTQKAVSKNDGIIDASKGQAVAQDLGKDTFIKSTEEETVNSTYSTIKKKLSPEEVKALKDEQENAKVELIKKFISDTINNQNKLLGKSTGNETAGMSKETTALLSKIFGSVENAYPPIETTKAGAEKAIAEGGAYSVNAVADRIMTMAKFIAGDDPNKLQQMREAVEKGFSEAGLDFGKATNSELPQICKDTMAEVMKRFDELQNKTSSK